MPCNWFKAIAVWSFFTLNMALVALATSNWFVMGDLTKGLWRSCIREFCIISWEVSTEIKVVRTLEIIGVVILTVGFIFSLRTAFWKKHVNRMEYTFLFAGIDFFVSTAIYDPHMSQYHGFSYYVNCLVAVLCGILVWATKSALHQKSDGW